MQIAISRPAQSLNDIRRILGENRFCAFVAYWQTQGNPGIQWFTIYLALVGINTIPARQIWHYIWPQD